MRHIGKKTALGSVRFLCHLKSILCRLFSLTQFCIHCFQLGIIFPFQTDCFLLISVHNKENPHHNTGSYDNRKDNDKYHNKIDKF